MKKILIALMTLLAIAQAKDIETELRLAAGQIEVFDKTSDSYTIGYGANLYTNSDFLFGFSVDLSHSELEIISKTSTWSITTDLKAGYALFERKWNIYTIGSAMTSSSQIMESAGFGYGVGTDVRLTDHIALSVEAKTYNLSSDKIPDYDLKTINGFVKFVF